MRSEGRRPREQAAGERAISQAGELRSSRIESLRALAALGVVFSHIYLSHFYPSSGAAAYTTFWHRTLLAGGFGVWVFFGLTGYLLYLPFVRRDLAAGPQLSYARYARNRAVRILPLYYVVTVVSLIFVDHVHGVGTWIRFLVFGENFSRTTIARLDGPVWSLVIELHFYILLPFLALGLAAVGRRSVKGVTAALAVLGLAALALRWVTVDHPHTINPLWQYNLPSTFVYFIPGMLLAVLKVSWDRDPPDWLQRNRLARNPATWLALTVPLWVLTIHRYDWDPLVAVVTFLTIGACVLPLDSSPALRALEWRPLAVLGVASYSLYLWHLPIVNHLIIHQMRGDSFLLMLAVQLPLTCLVALVSYRLIEAPFLRIRKGWQGTPAQTTST